MLETPKGDGATRRYDSRRRATYTDSRRRVPSTTDTRRRGPTGLDSRRRSDTRRRRRRVSDTRRRGNVSDSRRRRTGAPDSRRRGNDSRRRRTSTDSRRRRYSDTRRRVPSANWAVMQDSRRRYVSYYTSRRRSYVPNSLNSGQLYEIRSLAQSNCYTTSSTNSYMYQCSPSWGTTRQGIYAYSNSATCTGSNSFYTSTTSTCQITGGSSGTYRASIVRCFCNAWTLQVSSSSSSSLSTGAVVGIVFGILACCCCLGIAAWVFNKGGGRMGDGGSAVQGQI